MSPEEEKVARRVEETRKWLDAVKDLPPDLFEPLVMQMCLRHMGKDPVTAVEQVYHIMLTISTLLSIAAARLSRQDDIKCVFEMADEVSVCIRPDCIKMAERILEGKQHENLINTLAALMELEALKESVTRGMHRETHH